MFLFNGAKVQLCVYLVAVVEFQLSWSQSPFVPEETNGLCASRAESESIKISCGPKEKIAIHEAYFASSDTGNRHCPFSVPQIQKAKLSKSIHSWPAPCAEDLRISINARCSGLSECEFNLNEHHTLKCSGDGYTVVRHVCVPDSKLKNYCNLKLKSSYGYVATPGYPELYPQHNCSWMIEGEEGQRVQLAILDARINDPKIVGYLPDPDFAFRKIPRTQCTDHLGIYEKAMKRYELCGSNESNLIQWTSTSNVVNVSFVGYELRLLSGVLFRYSLQGCPTLPAPRKGHLMYRNDSLAVYSCCEDHVFEDTREKTKVLYCTHGVQWNTTLTKCIPISNVETTTTTERSTIDVSNYLPREQKSSHEEHYFSDIVIPVLLMSFLIIANAFIVWILLKLRRRQRIRRERGAATPLNSPTDV